MVRTRSFREYESRYSLRRTSARELRQNTTQGKSRILRKRQQARRHSVPVHARVGTMRLESSSPSSTATSTPSTGNRRVTRGLVASASKPKRVTRSVLRRQGGKLEDAVAASSRVEESAQELRSIVRNFSLIYQQVVPAVV